MRRHHLIEQDRQTMQIMGSKDQLHMTIMRQQGIDDRFFLRHTAADTDDQIRILFFQALELSQFAKHLVFGVFADRTGIQ